MNYYDLPIGKAAPETVNAVIEIASGTHNKYEYDQALGVFTLDRVLHSPMYYPVDYGFIPQTHADDGDPLDVLVLTDSPTFTGCVCAVRPIGALTMTDDKGGDDKILAVPVGNPHYRTISDLSDLEPHFLDEISHFFATYKTLEKKEVKVEGWHDKMHALTLIEKARKAYVPASH